MILGIDLGGTNIRIGQIENGALLKKQSAPSPSDKSLDDSICYLKSAIRQMMTPKVKGIGIGVPSVLDIERGIVYNVANIPSWVEVHLKDILQEEFRLPVFINNDSNCFTLGEKYFGEGKPFKDMVGVTLGTGVGAGIIADNKLYGGSNTGAGEIGCLPYLNANFEHYCGSEFFTTYHQTTGQEAAAKAKAGDVSVKHIWDEFGKHMGNLVQAILYTYDPEAIIFGGGISEALPLFSAKMHEAMTTFAYPETLNRIQIKTSTNADISILGAGALVTKIF